MTIGAIELLNKYDSRLELAEAILDGKVDSYYLQFANELLDSTIRWAAEVRWKQKQKNIAEKANV